MKNYEKISGFADEIAQELDVQIEVVSRLGIQYIEMRGVDGNNLIYHPDAKVKEIKQKLENAGIKLSALGSPLGKIGIEDPFEPHFEEFKRACEIAHRMDTKNIRMFSFYIPEGKKKEYKGKVFDRLGRFADYAGRNDIVLLHENEKGIIHTVSTGCKDYLINNLYSPRLIDHNTQNRIEQLEEFKRSNEPLVLISPSMNEGVDLPGDLCRFQIIYKLPYPDLADKQIRLRANADSDWYDYKTSLSLIQTYGRGMRFEDDYCITYFIDSRIRDFVEGDKFIPNDFKYLVGQNNLDGQS